MTKVVIAAASVMRAFAGIEPTQTVRRPWRRWFLPGALAGLVALGACSTLSLGYGQGVNLGYWWLDRYVNFNDEQKPRVRAALQDWMNWHRSQPLADDIALLEQAAREARQDLTPAQVCAWWDKYNQRRSLYLTQLLPAVVDLAATLEPRQLDAIQARQASKDADWRDEHLQAKPADRLDGEVKRVRERAETLYGKLDSAQRRYLVERLQGVTPWDAQRWHAGMLHEQSMLLSALRALAAAAPGTPGAAEARKQLGEAVLRPDAGFDAATKVWHQQLLTYQCTVGSELHNRTSAEQRETAARNLRAWAQDLRGHLPPGAAAVARPIPVPNG